MKLHSMANAFRESLNNIVAKKHECRLFVSLLISRKWDYRSAAAILRLIKCANFRYPNALPEEIDYVTLRNLDRNQMERILSLDFIRQAGIYSSQIRPGLEKITLQQPSAMKQVR